MGLVEDFDRELSFFVLEHHVGLETTEDKEFIRWRLPEATSRVAGAVYDKRFRLYGVIDSAGAILAHHTRGRTKGLFKCAAAAVEQRRPYETIDRTFELVEE